MPPPLPSSPAAATLLDRDLAVVRKRPLSSWSLTSQINGTPIGKRTTMNDAYTAMSV